MPDQIQHETPAVVGEDGELIQADTTVDPDAYAEYVATHVRRDPLLFRMREYIREHKSISLILILSSLCMASRLIEDLFSNPAQLGNDVLAIILLILGISIFARVVYMILQIDTRQ